MKKLKGILILGFFVLFGIGISFGNSTYSVSVLRTSIYNTNISDSKNITSKNYYSPSSFEYVNRNQNCRSIYTFNGYGIYTNFSSFTFNYLSGLNNYYYLHNNNGNIESVQYSVGGCNTDISNPTYYDSSYFNYGYNNSVFNGSVSFIPYFTQGRYSFPNGYYLGWGNTGGNSINTSFSQYVHLYYNVGVSDFSYNPGIINGSVDILHYLYWDGKKIYSDYGYYSDVPDSYTRKKLFENLNSTYSYIAVPDSYDVLDSSNIEFFSSYGPVQWSFNESNNSYHIFPSITGGHLLLNFIDYESEYLTGNSTLVLQLSGDSIIYNYYYNYSPFIQQLDLNNPAYKGYLTSDGSSLSAFNLFVAFLTDNGFYFDSVGSFQSGLTLRSYRYGNQSTNQYGDYHFDFIESSDIPVIIVPDGSNSGIINITGVNTSSMYYNCLGPYYNTPDGLPPAYCYNSSGELNPQRFQNCFDVIEQVSTGGFITHTFCYIDGFQQEVVLTPDGSGYSVVPGVNNTNFLDWLNDGYSTGYFDNFLNSTGYFFKCPFPYSESLTVRPKLISMMNGFDINLPINCAFAGFAQGKQVFTFEHSGHLIQGGPLLNFEGDNRKLLYTFFDILIIIGLLFFFGKILKFFS